MSYSLIPKNIVPINTETKDVIVAANEFIIELNRSLEVEVGNDIMSLKSLDEKMAQHSYSCIEDISCPIDALTHHGHTNCANAFQSKDKLKTFVDCSCPDCLNNGVTYLVQSRFDMMESYLEFQKNHVLITGQKGAVFYKTYENDLSVTKLALMRKDGVKDAWANDLVPILVKNGMNSYEKNINVADIAINGTLNCLSPREDIADSESLEYIHKYGDAMERYHAICFSPNVTTREEYNLWQGFPLKAQENTIEPFLDFLYEAVGKHEAKHILDFFAHMIQKPEEKPRFCLVFKGAKGTGKNTVEETLGKDLLYSSNYYRSSQPAQFFGKFNFHIAQNILSVLQELKWDEKSDHDSILKDMITETSRSVEQKYMDQIMLDNYSRIVITTNEDWAIPASGREERRYCVISFPEKKTEALDKKIKAFYTWKKQNPIEASQAIMYFLKNRKLSRYSIDKAPETKGLIEQKTLSLKGVEKFVFDALSNGYFGNINAKENKGYGYLEVQQNNRIRRSHLFGCFQMCFPKERISAQKFHEKMSDLIDSRKIQSNGTWTEFKELQASICSFKKATGITVFSESRNWSS